MSGLFIQLTAQVVVGVFHRGSIAYLGTSDDQSRRVRCQKSFHAVRSLHKIVYRFIWPAWHQWSTRVRASSSRWATKWVTISSSVGIYVKVYALAGWRQPAAAFVGMTVDTPCAASASITVSSTVSDVTAGCLSSSVAVAAVSSRPIVVMGETTGGGGSVTGVDGVVVTPRAAADGANTHAANGSSLSSHPMNGSSSDLHSDIVGGGAPTGFVSVARCWCRPLTGWALCTSIMCLGSDELCVVSKRHDGHDTVPSRPTKNINAVISANCQHMYMNTCIDNMINTQKLDVVVDLPIFKDMVSPLGSNFA